MPKTIKNDKMASTGESGALNIADIPGIASILANIANISSASNVSNISANSITSGVLQADRLPTTLALESLTATTLAGNGANITGISADNIASGVLRAGRLPTALSLESLTATSLAGNGASITGISANNIASGMLAAARLPSNLAVQNVTATNLTTGALTATSISAGTLAGNGAALTNLRSENVVGLDGQISSLSSDIDARLQAFKSSTRLYVSTTGSDANDGRSLAAPLRTIRKACELATSGTTIMVETGSYTEVTPIVVPANVAIIGDNLRRVLLYAVDPRLDYFHANNLVYLWGLRFVNLKRPAFCVAFPCATADCTVQNGQLASVTVLYSPTGYTEAPTVYIEPPDVGTRAEATAVVTGGVITAIQITNAGSGYTQRPHISIHASQRPFITGSPYIQNCSSITGPFDTAGNIISVATPLPYDESNVAGSGRVVDVYGAGGGIRIDGIVCHPSSPLRSFVADAFTQVNQGGPGHLIINMGYAQFVSCFTTFCTYSFKAASGSYCNISNSVSDFGLYGLVSKGYWHVPFTTGTVTTSLASSVSSVSVTDGGSGYAVAPTVSLVGGGGAGATAEAQMDGGKVVGVVVTNGGTGYTSVPTVVFSAGAATATATLSGTGPVNVQMPTYRKPDIGSAMLLGGQWYMVVGSSPSGSANAYDVSLFPQPASVTSGTSVPFHAVSSVSTGSHVMEYVGSGCTYNALPEYGGVPVAGNEVIEVSPGRCFYTTSDHLGNAKVGKFFEIEQATGTVTISTDRFNLAGLNSIGPFRRNGVGVGVQLQEVSNNPDLIASTGAPDATTVPTQRAVKTYVDARVLPSAGNASQVLAKRSNNDFDITWSTIDKASIGLANVIDAAQLVQADKGAANGVATLDANACLVADQLPANARFTSVTVGSANLVSGALRMGDVFVANDFVRVGTSQSVNSNLTTQSLTVGSGAASLSMFGGLRYASSYTGTVLVEKNVTNLERWGLSLTGTNDVRLISTGVGTTGRVMIGHAVGYNIYADVLTVARNNTSTTTGNVGINISTPMDALHVAGNIRATTFNGNVTGTIVTAQALGFDSLSKGLPERFLSERLAEVNLQEQSLVFSYEGNLGTVVTYSSPYLINTPALDPVSGRMFFRVRRNDSGPDYDLVSFDTATNYVSVLTRPASHTPFVYVPRLKKLVAFAIQNHRALVLDPATLQYTVVLSNSAAASTYSSVVYVEEYDELWAFGNSGIARYKPDAILVTNYTAVQSNLFSLPNSGDYNYQLPIVIPNRREVWYMPNTQQYVTIVMRVTTLTTLATPYTDLSHMNVALPFLPACFVYSPITDSVVILANGAATDTPFLVHVDVASRAVTAVIWNNALATTTNGYRTLAFDTRNNKIYAIPLTASQCLEIDPVTNSITPIGPTFGNTYDYQGCVVDTRGDIFCVPRGPDNRMLKIQTSKTTRAQVSTLNANTLTANGNVVFSGQSVIFAQEATMSLPRSLVVRPKEANVALAPLFTNGNWNTYDDLQRTIPLYMPAYVPVNKRVYVTRPTVSPTFNQISLTSPYTPTVLTRPTTPNFDKMMSLTYVPTTNTIYIARNDRAIGIYYVGNGTHTSSTQDQTTYSYHRHITYMPGVDRLLVMANDSTSLGQNMYLRLVNPSTLNADKYMTFLGSYQIPSSTQDRYMVPPVVIGNTAWVMTTDGVSNHRATQLSVTASTISSPANVALPNPISCALYVEPIDRIVCLTDGRNGANVSIITINLSDTALQTATWDNPLANTELAYRSLALHPETGVVYAIPFNATRVLTIQPTQADPSTWTLQTVGPEFVGNMKWYGAVYEGGDVFGVPYQMHSLLKVSQYKPSSIAADSHLVLSNATALSNTVIVSNAVAKLANVSGYTYEYGTSRVRAAGLLADDVASALPEAVATLDDGSKAIDYAGACALLVNAVKELAVRVSALEAP